MKTNDSHSRVHHWLLVLTGLLIFSSCSSTRKIEKIFSTSTVFHQGFAGLAVYDLEENRMIYEHNSEKYFTPASNIKLFTFYTGLVTLKDSVPALQYWVNNDTLIFAGTGDPSFLNPDLTDSKIYKFLKDREEQLFYLLPSYREKYFGPGWSWDDYNSYYSVERTDFPIFANRVSFKKSVYDPVPKVFPSIFTDSISPTLGVKEKTGIRRALEKNRFVYSPGLIAEGFKQDVPFKYSSELLVNVLQDTLKKEIRIIDRLPAGFSERETLYSVPVDSIFKTMLEVSDNFIAEQVLLLAAHTIADTLRTEISIKYMKENYLNDLPDEPYWVDGSGLSRYNLVTPRSMVMLLTKIKEEVPQERLFNLLAVGGVSGTLKNYYAADEPYIYAKTGTLRNNHSLSGYLKAKSGTILAFSFMNSNYTVPTNHLKEEMETILKELYEKN